MTAPFGFVKVAVPSSIEGNPIFSVTPISANAFVSKSPCSFMSFCGMLLQVYQPFSAQSASSSSIRRQKF